MPDELPHRFRFDLADVFALTTAVAVTLLLARLPLLLAEKGAPAVLIHLALTMISMALGATVGALVKRKRRFALYAATAYLLIAIPSTFFEQPNALGWTLIALAVSVVGAQVVLLKLFRPD